ncbi:sensor histidine kinase [Candidatus Methylopumilus planktonicus]|uniref:sensor histidine kinase n=1 Tax=Candidatus Methylopumilus planktonicus TaxID=1581557 RepID=UPI003BEF2B8C
MALKYWACSLILSSISIFCIAAGSAVLTSLQQGSFFLTLSNTMYFISLVMLVIYSKSLKDKITDKDIKIFTLLIISYGIGFEIIRQKGTFIDRQTFSASLLFIVYFVLLVEIKKQKLFHDSYYLKIFTITTLIEFILLFARLIVLITNDFGFIDRIDDAPIIPAALLWSLLIVNIWSYISINGYWTEKIATADTKNLIENTKIKLLLDEKYKLINSLMTANKTAISGALSASIAHEINQPLGAIKINSQHLNLLIKDKQKKLLIKNIIKDNDRLAKIITTLKSTFTNNESVYETRVFDDFIRSLEPFFKEAAKGRGISIKFLLNTSIKVNINSDELRQVFSNLLQNSIEVLSSSSKKNKLIEIKTYKKDNKLVCSLSDNGPGVSKKIQGRLFELYETSKKSNSGIGLWLSKYIISKHKGRLSLNTAYLDGAEFLIELPVSHNAKSIS